MRWGRVSYIVLFSVVFITLIGLGFWQYGRYQQKKAWLASLAQTKLLPMLGAANLKQKKWQRFRRIKLQGVFKPQKSFFISGEFRQSRAGYSIITPLQWAPTEPWVLVDRGWAPAEDGRNPPILQAPLTKDWVIGRVYSPVGKRFTLGPWQLPNATGVAVVQDWDFVKIARLLGHPVMPFVVRLSPQLPGHYQRRWVWTASIPPSRHLAYALQWWAFAMVWLAGAAALVNKKKVNTCRGEKKQ
jgi:cytochrome oxidase assembly protein ShyY1